MSQQQNIASIRKVNDAPGDQASEVVCVGGATVSLYANRPAGESRPTDDVYVVQSQPVLTSYPDIKLRYRCHSPYYKQKYFHHD